MTQRILYEVERKFIFVPSLLPKFHHNLGIPPFRQLLHRKDTSFRDTYFDSSGVLMKNKIWVRKRDNKWEAKKSMRGDYRNTAYEEYNSIDSIHKLVTQYLPKNPGSEQNFGLETWCDFVTHRKSYLADEKFTVVLDTTDFRHAVGEVEVMAEDMDAADGEIEAFLRNYPWFFREGTPKGKITAYLERFGMGPGGRQDGES
ncbi:hypothetical protein RUND412_002819 [Rhizina undulata]